MKKCVLLFLLSLALFGCTQAPVDTVAAPVNPPPETEVPIPTAIPTAGVQPIPVPSNLPAVNLISSDRGCPLQQVYLGQQVIASGEFGFHLMDYAKNYIKYAATEISVDGAKPLTIEDPSVFDDISGNQGTFVTVWHYPLPRLSVGVHKVEIKMGVTKRIMGSISPEHPLDKVCTVLTVLGPNADPKAQIELDLVSNKNPGLCPVVDVFEKQPVKIAYSPSSDPKENLEDTYISVSIERITIDGAPSTAVKGTDGWDPPELNSFIGIYITKWSAQLSSLPKGNHLIQVEFGITQSIGTSFQTIITPDKLIDSACGSLIVR